MSLDAKWNEGLSPTMPVAEAAKIIFDARFETLLKHWKTAAENADDVETIHHLRVASRRASTALAAFGSLLPRGQLRDVKKRVRRVRRAAGDVRDRDVFLENLGKWAKKRSETEWPGCDYLCGIWANSRRRRCRRLFPLLERHEKFAAIAAHLHLQGGRKKSLADRAREVLPQLSSDFADATADFNDDSNKMHPIRILAKQLRYGLELFVCCYPAGQLDDAYGMLEEVQDIIGAFHDAQVNADRVNEELKHLVARERYCPGIEAWLQHLQSIEAAGPDNLRDWLSRWPAVAPALIIDDENRG